MPKIMRVFFLLLVGIYLSIIPVSASATDLHRAAGRGDVAQITRLLDRGADIEARSELGFTPLHGAAQEGQSRAITTLLGRGAKIESRDMFGFTPLHTVAYFRHSVAIITLLDRGADAKARNNAGKRPIDLANDKNMAKGAAYWRLHDASY